MSIMDSDGLSASEMIVGFGDTMDDRDVLGHWMKPPKQLGSNMTGVIILSVVLVAIAIAFFGCYLLLRFVHRALGTDGRKQNNPSPYSNVVIHSKRVYEIQAEEGCFNPPPDIHDPPDDPTKCSFSETSTSKLGAALEEDRKILIGPRKWQSPGQLISATRLFYGCSLLMMEDHCRWK
ncbi:hypothetical protein RB195_014273 [Necator americanus]|uniref:Uncharacterized protein n=1 Tax=Necator americanus TaxID=51031 RepID=A0ABR1DZR4_NECAM